MELNLVIIYVCLWFSFIRLYVRILFLHYNDCFLEEVAMGLYLLSFRQIYSLVTQF